MHLIGRSFCWIFCWILWLSLPAIKHKCCSYALLGESWDTALLSAILLAPNPENIVRMEFKQSLFTYLTIFAKWVDWICVDNTPKVFWVTWITVWKQIFLFLSSHYSPYAPLVAILWRRVHGLAMVALSHQLPYIHWHVAWAKRKSLNLNFQNINTLIRIPYWKIVYQLFHLLL